MLKFMLILGIICHAINMYCDRRLSIFPNRTLCFQTIGHIKEEGFLKYILSGVPASVPMLSSVLGVFAIVFEFFGYLSIALYAYSKSPLFGTLLFLAAIFFCILASGYHVKTGLSEYVFIKLGMDEKAKDMMIDLMNSGTILRLCFVGLVTYIIILIITIINGTIGFPLWSLLFTMRKSRSVPAI